MAVGRCHQLFDLGYGKCSEDVGNDSLQNTTKPNIKEIRQVSVAYIVIVGRIGGDEFAYAYGLELSISLGRATYRGSWYLFEGLRNPFYHSTYVS